MNPDVVFKAYDVRGRIDNGDLDEGLYRLVGAGLVALLDVQSVAVGRDCRSSSMRFFEALAEGLTDSGADVVDLGEVPTDAVYYYSGRHDMAGGMITASHNPPVYNGLKLCRPGAAPIGEGTGLDWIKDYVVTGVRPTTGARGSVVHVDVIPDYINHLLSIVPPSEIGPLDVAVDAGNGMAGVALGDVFARIPASLTGLYLEPDGSFPNHPADPLVPENLHDLQDLMTHGDYDLGVAFDGDADRAFFLDDLGSPLSGSTVTSLIARRLLELHPGSPVVHNLITSRAVAEIVSEAGGVPVRTRVGHSFIKQVMADTGAVFGGEHSGHYYFRDNFKADSGMLAMLFLLSVLTRSGKRLSLLRTEVERYATSGEINFVVGDPNAAMALVEQMMRGAAADHSDGLTVDLGDEWFNLRPSNTEPLLRLNVEAGDPVRVGQIVDDIKRILEGS